MIDPITELKKEIQRARVTQNEFARQLGISPQFLSDILKGNRSPGTAVLERLGLEKRVIYRRIRNGAAAP
jgi:transcriptional regulator with XRE-family HTH domain